MTQPDIVITPEAKRKLKKIIDKMARLHPDEHWRIITADHKLLWDSEWDIDDILKEVKGEKRVKKRR